MCRGHRWADCWVMKLAACHRAELLLELQVNTALWSAHGTRERRKERK